MIEIDFNVGGRKEGLTLESSYSFLKLLNGKTVDSILLTEDLSEGQCLRHVDIQFTDGCSLSFGYSNNQEFRDIFLAPSLLIK